MPKKKGQTAKAVREKAFEDAKKYEHIDKTALRDHARKATRLRHKHDNARCGAKTRQGGRCTLASGWGTPHPGTGRCKWHGGSMPTHVKAAVKDEYRKLLGVELEINPFEAVMWCIKIRAGEVQWLSTQMTKLDEKAWTEDTLVGKQFHLYARERQAAMSDLVKYSQVAISMGIAERYVRLAEVYGQTIAKLIDGILGDLELNEQQRADAPMVIRRHLLMIEGGTDVLVEGSAQRQLSASNGKAK